MRANLIAFLCLGCFTVYGDDHVLSRVRRIIGGRPLQEGEAPYLTFVFSGGTTRKRRSIFRWSSGGDIRTTTPTPQTFPPEYLEPETYCTGTLVNQNWAMTSAHCFDGTSATGQSMRDPSLWRLRIGSVSLQTARGKMRGNRYSWLQKIQWFRKTNFHTARFVDIDRIIVHPDYTVESLASDDIAVVRLRDPVSFGPNVNDIELNTDPNFPPDGALCSAQGWGCTTDNDGPASTVARTVELPIFDSMECAMAVEIDNALCAGSFDQNRGVCAGDSGGPLICRRGNDFVQVGVTSLANENDPGNNPGVFTRVSTYVDWIRSITE